MKPSRLRIEIGMAKELFQRIETLHPQIGKFEAVVRGETIPNDSAGRVVTGDHKRTVLVRNLTRGEEAVTHTYLWAFVQFSTTTMGKAWRLTSDSTRKRWPSADAAY